MWCSGSASRSSLGVLLLVAACNNDPAPRSDPDALAPALSREQLLDPEQCKGCHPKHYREWKSSMHAYAAEDPVFRAMNQRGQRETDGALGDFCVRCHAPMALREGATQDGLNLDSVPAALQGVTCYFCHNATGVEQPFNAHVTLADDTTMRAGIQDAVATGAHRSQYSGFHDRNRAESATLCGGCHDVVNAQGVHLERTSREYQDSLFGLEGPSFDTCSGCHMPGRPGRAAENADRSTPPRVLHEHLWPGVDVALSDWPDREAQRHAVECALGYNARIVSILRSGPSELSVEIDSAAGHHQPSGTAQDRRLWLELIAYDADGRVLFQSGVIADGEVEDKLPGEPGYDPHLTLYRDWLYDADGAPVHMFWEAAPSAAHPDGYESLTLPPATKLGVPHTLRARYRIAELARVARVTARLLLRPIGIDVLEDLVHSGDLDPKVVAELPTHSLYGAAKAWDPQTGALTPLEPEAPLCPESYRCLLQPNEDGCE
jgi:Cytochrome c554 and c-prime